MFERVLLTIGVAAAIVASCGLAAPNAVLGQEAPVRRPELIKLPGAIPHAMENTPVEFNGRRLLLLNYRDDAKNNTDGYVDSMYLYALDLHTGERVAEFGKGHSFVSGFVDGDALHVFASEGSNHDWFQSIHHFWTKDLKTWQEAAAIEREGDEHLFNCSICRDPHGYLMAYESNEPVAFCFRFARSNDLMKWDRVPNLIFLGETREYSACPVIRYCDPYYYVLYLHAPVEGRNGWLSYIARSRDLKEWQLSSLNPVLEAGQSEGTNNSDIDLIEIDQRTYLFYATGDQQTWSSVRMAMYDGPLKEFFESWFPADAATKTVSTEQQ